MPSDAAGAGRIVGIDTGGTFTDFSVEGRVHKVRSTPDDPSRAVLQGLADLNREGTLRVVHGTTVATNALLTGNCAKTAFVTTAGLEDLLEIGRQDRARLYALEPQPRPSLVPRDLRFGVKERLAPDGSVETPLDARDIVDRIKNSGAEAVAICLLHAYRDGRHEDALAELLAPTGLPVSRSSRVACEFREYERAVTTTANASLIPVLAPYIKRLHEALAEHDLEVLQSSGGTATPMEVMERPVATVLSGPAGGVVAATDLARRHGIARAVSFDMGGTSTDVALIRPQADDGEAGEGLGAELRSEFRIDGLPLRVPVLDVHTVGAGGGSIAHTDALGALRVGPQSAGADPGPACYGSGEQPTVTDAHLVLGHLSEEDPLAGSLLLDRARATRAVHTACDDANDILRVANATMERAIRAVTVRRGIDPAPCTLIAFGGAGGLHACSLADALGMRTVLIPVAPGTFSAHGMRTADRRRDYVKTVLLHEPDFTTRIDELFGQFPKHDAPVEVRTADARYEGQSHELSVEADARIAERFHAAHEQAFGYSDRTRGVEIVNVRLAAIHPAPRPPALVPPEPKNATLGPPRIARADISAPILGPTVVTETTATTVVPRGWSCTPLADGTLRLDRAEDIR
ncbi:MAG: hydantoinase/oxoprolinase family protein [Planctomycetota bacterium]|jgi:N-methylhydantoinase A